MHSPEPSEPHNNDDPRTIPLAPLALGLAGLIPFWGLTAALPFAPVLGASRDETMVALALYAAVIVSFLGGIRWGLATTAPQRQAAVHYGLAVIPSLLGWAAVLLPPSAAILAGLGVVLLLLGPIDRRLVTLGLAPPWFSRLRLILSGGAGAALLIASLLTIRS